MILLNTYIITIIFSKINRIINLPLIFKKNITTKPKSVITETFFSFIGFFYDFVLPLKIIGVCMVGFVVLKATLIIKKIYSVSQKIPSVSLKYGWQNAFYNDYLLKSFAYDPSLKFMVEWTTYDYFGVFSTMHQPAAVFLTSMCISIAKYEAICHNGNILSILWNNQIYRNEFNCLLNFNQKFVNDSFLHLLDSFRFKHQLSANQKLTLVEEYNNYQEKCVNNNRIINQNLQKGILFKGNSTNIRFDSLKESNFTQQNSCKEMRNHLKIISNILVDHGMHLSKPPKIRKIVE